MRWFPNPSEFINNYDELHVFVIGFCELFCLWARRKIPAEIKPLIVRKFWYYRFGKFVASMLLLGLGILIYLYIIK